MLFCVLCNLLIFAVAHINFLHESTISSYALLYLNKIWSMIFVPLAAIFSISRGSERGVHALIFFPLLFSLTKVVYYLPYYYELYVLEGYMVSTEALLTSAFLTATVFLVSYAHVLIYVLITKLLGYLFARRNIDPEAAVSPFDLSHPTALTSLGCATLGFIYTVVFELLDTIPFLKLYMSTLSGTEIVTMIFNYVLIIGIHVGIYSTSVKHSFPTYYHTAESTDSEE